MNIDLTSLPDWAWFVIVPVALWSFFWKALALWHSARRGSGAWFIVFMIVNTVGILEIVYLISIRKLNVSELFKK